MKKELADRLIEAISSNADSKATAADPAAQSSGDAPSTADEAVISTDNLPSELPAVPPAIEDPTNADVLGADATLSEAVQSNPPPDVSTQPSEVVKPAVDTVDKTPGVVSDSRENPALIAKLDEPYTNGSGEKRKRDEELEKVNEDDAGMHIRIPFDAALLNPICMQFPLSPYKPSPLSLTTI